MENTTLLAQGTSLETIKSQTQQKLLYKGLENNAEARRGDQARAMLEEVAEVAVAQATQSMLALPDESLVDTTRRGKVQRTDSDGFELVNKKIPEDQGD